jgi:hypothetical protein
MVVLPERDMNVAGHPERGRAIGSLWLERSAHEVQQNLRTISSPAAKETWDFCVFSMFYPRLNIVKLNLTLDVENPWKNTV